MNLEIAIVLFILFAAVVFFLTDKISPDVVAVLVVLALLLTRALHTADAFAGFANPAVITIASIFLVTAGLTNTGIAAWIGHRILRVAGEKESRLIAVTMGAAALFSLVMNNIASASVLLPGITSIARQTRISPSKLLIPLSFGTLLGGMATLFTTTNILVNDTLRTKGLLPFSLWDFFRIGSILAVAGIVYMITVGSRLLPSHTQKVPASIRRLPEDLARIYQIPERLFEARVLAGSPLDGKTVAESRFGQSYDLSIVGIFRQGRVKLAPSREEVLRAGDRLLIEGEEARLKQSQESLGLVVQTESAGPVRELADRDTGIVELVVSPHATVVGRSLREIHFREKFGLTVLALLREGQPLHRGVSETSLEFGDALLVQGPRPRLRLLRAESDFILLEEPDPDEIARPNKAPWALLGLALMVVLAGLGLVRTATAAMLGAMMMVLSGALTMEEGYRAVEWRAVVLIGGMLSMGTALDKSGAAALISSKILNLSGSLGPLVVLAGFYLIAMLLTQAMSGSATAVLLAPVAFNTSAQLHVSPYPFLMTVILATSSAFLSPVSHPANVLVMGPGGYKFTDYGRTGVFLTLLIFVLILVLVPRLWPF